MPRLILDNDTKTASALTQVTSRSSVNASNDLSVQYYLRKKRSRNYLNWFKNLDTSHGKVDPETIKRIISMVKEEFPDLAIADLPLGYVSKCYLGRPFEVHILDLKLEIVEHYKEYEGMPGDYERARALALNPAYILVEVYLNTLRAISEDGEVSVI